jgi:homoserine O-acetyltransferase
VTEALAAVTADVTVAGISTDRLYPLELQRELAALLPAHDDAVVIESPYGHDGFLLEVDQVGAMVSAALKR